MLLKSIDHFVITTSNLQECLHFYVEILGMEHIEFAEGRHMLRFGNEKINIHNYPGEFSPYAKNATFGAQDFCLIAEGNIHEIKQMIEEKKWPIEVGVVQQEGARGVMDSIYMFDPDGNLVEIAVYR